MLFRSNETTALLHGRKAAEESAETARKTFEEGASAEGLPTFEIDLSKPVGLLQANVTVGFATSNSDARRSVQGGSIRVNDVLVTDDKLQLSLANLNADGVIKLSKGKKTHVLIKPK